MHARRYTCVRVCEFYNHENLKMTRGNDLECREEDHGNKMAAIDVCVLVTTGRVCGRFVDTPVKAYLGPIIRSVKTIMTPLSRLP